MVSLSSNQYEAIPDLTVRFHLFLYDHSLQRCGIIDIVSITFVLLQAKAYSAYADMLVVGSM